jgi:hypothetical protein
MGTNTTMAEQTESQFLLAEAEYQIKELTEYLKDKDDYIKYLQRINAEQHKHVMELLEQNEQLKAEKAFLKGKVEIMGRNALEKFQSLEYTIASYKQGVMCDFQLSQEVKEVVPKTHP